MAEGAREEEGMIAERWDKKWEGDEIVLEGWCKGKEGWTEFLRQQYRLLKHGRSTVKRLMVRHAQPSSLLSTRFERLLFIRVNGFRASLR